MRHRRGISCSMAEPSLFLMSMIMAHGAAAAVWPIWRIGGRFAVAVAVGYAVAVLYCLLLIPASHIGLRALAAVLCIHLAFKVLDVTRQSREQGRAVCGFRDYACFLIPFPVMSVVFVRCDHPRLMPERPLAELFKALRALVVIASGFLLVALASRLVVIRDYFLVDHAVKLAIFVITIGALSRMLYRIERLAGFDTVPVVDRAHLSRTVADFWCRFNTRVHAWFYHNVFLPCGGRRAPVRGVLLVFFLSGIIHELGFGLATSRFDGYQFLFFMLQAPAVLVSRPLHRLTRGNAAGRVALRVATILWLSVTSIFFFHAVDRVFPFFYASDPWLP